MITAVDTNVLLDILVPGAPHGDSSEQALIVALGAGATVISEAVYAELAAQFTTREELDHFLQDTGLRLLRSGADALYLAGQLWQDYLRQRPAYLSCPACGESHEVHCRRCGARLAPRQHVVADFLIGAHATVHSDRLLTRDRGYYRRYFSELHLA